MADSEQQRHSVFTQHSNGFETLKSTNNIKIRINHAIRSQLASHQPILNVDLALIGLCFCVCGECHKIEANSNDLMLNHPHSSSDLKR